MIALDIPARSDDGMPWRWTWVAGIARALGWRSGAELGVKRGHFSLYLVDHVPGLRMIAVDTWANGPGVSERYRHYRHAANFTRFCERAEGRPIEIRRALTHEAARDCPDRSLDFVFIDASHDYDSVLRDIDDWTPKARDMVLGHDWDEPGVRRAVVGRFDRVVEGPDKCWGVVL